MKTQKFVIITRNSDFNHAKNPPGTAVASQAMTNIGGTVIKAEEKEELGKWYTKVDFIPPAEGNYETGYPNELARLVRGGARANSWGFEWG